MIVLKLFHPEKEMFEVSLVRYIKIKDQGFLIYQQKEAEIDQSGYGRVYVAKINDHYSEAISEDEWRELKDQVKQIVKQNMRKESLSIEDLDYHLLSGTIINEYRVFRFEQPLVELLKENYSFEEDDIEEEKIKRPQIKEAIRVPYQQKEDSNLNYKELYELMQKKNKELEEELIDLQNRTMSYQLKYDQIRKILEENDEKDKIAS